MKVSVMVFHQPYGSVHRNPVGMYVGQAHEYGNHQSAVMEIFVFVHLFYHDDFTVGRSYDNVFRVPFETSDRASEEIDYDKVDDRAYGCRNIERELAFKSIVKAGVEQQQHPCTCDERVRSFPMYSDFF